jgi:hypothetical protein
MANVNVTVKASLKYKGGLAATSVAVKAIRQADPLLASTMATADIIEATSNSSTGIVTLTLVGTDAIPVSYKVVLNDGQYFYLNLPKNAGSCNLGIITVSASPAIGVKDITSQINPAFLGANITAAATIVPTCKVHKVSGATGITGITATDFPIGEQLTLVFIDGATVTEGNNLVMAGNFTAGANDVITFVCDGTDFIEIARSNN